MHFATVVALTDISAFIVSIAEAFKISEIQSGKTDRSHNIPSSIVDKLICTITMMKMIAPNNEINFFPEAVLITLHRKGLILIYLLGSSSFHLSFFELIASLRSRRRCGRRSPFPGCSVCWEASRFQTQTLVKKGAKTEIFFSIFLDFRGFPDFPRDFWDFRISRFTESMILDFFRIIEKSSSSSKLPSIWEEVDFHFHIYMHLFFDIAIFSYSWNHNKFSINCCSHLHWL